ncbi:30S ribosomal protein S17 [bacterium]|nr:30S ribosomal protein S17 [bacterium]MBU1937553.1 30S ribosomal protein S17 [bacterium]
MSAETAVSTRALRKTREGVVVSNKMDKSIVVAVERRVAHPLYKKYYRKTNTFMAHDAENTCQIGDRVRIMETRPLSKHKRWRLIEVLERKK